MKTSATTPEPAIIGTALVDTERELARLIDEVTRTGVTLRAMRSLLACVPQAPKTPPVELVEAISLLLAAETVVGTARGKVRNCSEALRSLETAQKEDPGLTNNRREQVSFPVDQLPDASSTDRTHSLDAA